MMQVLTDEELVRHARIQARQGSCVNHKDTIEALADALERRLNLKPKPRSWASVWILFDRRKQK